MKINAQSFHIHKEICILEGNFKKLRGQPASSRKKIGIKFVTNAVYNEAHLAIHTLASLISVLELSQLNRLE